MPDRSSLRWPLLSFLATIGACAAAGAEPAPLWSSRYNGGLLEASSSGWCPPAVDAGGNTYVAQSSSSGSSVLKYDPSGGLLWKTDLGPSFTPLQVVALAVDASGNVHATGSSSASGNGLDFGTVKVSAAGSVLWTASYDGPGHGDDKAVAIAVAANGDAYVTGSSWNGVDNDYRTIKYSGGTGQVIWSSVIDGPAHREDLPHALAVDSAGNAYVTGQSRSATSNDIRTVKHAAADGAVLWTAVYDGPAQRGDIGTALALDGTGHLTVTGYSSNGPNFDFVTLRLATADGATLWSARFDGADSRDDFAYALAVDASGNAYVTGSSATLDQGSNYRTIKYRAADGAVLWSVAYDGPSHGNDTGWSAAVDAAGNALVTGGSQTGSNDDIRTIKYAAQDGSLLWLATYDGETHGFDSPAGLALGPSGDVHLSGISARGALWEVRTIRYGSLDGSVVFSVAETSLRGSNDRPCGNGSAGQRSLALGQAGDVYVSGLSELGDGSLTVRTSPDGTVLWAALQPGLKACAVTVDAAGDAYVTGTVVDGNQVPQLTHARTVKYASADGHVVWDVVDTVHSSATALALDTAGHLYVAGNEDVWLDDLRHRVLKYSAADGALLWAVTNDVARAFDDFVSGLVVDAAGNAYVTGTSVGSGISYYRTLKLAAADGTVLWDALQDTTSSSGAAARALAVDDAGDAYVTGRDGYSSRTIKYASADGQLLWSVVGGASSADWVLALDRQGHVYVAGPETTSTLRVAKLATLDGATLWEVTTAWVWGPKVITVDASGDAFLAGSAEQDYQVIRLAAGDGRLLWSARYDGDGGVDTAVDLIVADGAAYVTGHSASAATGLDFLTLKYDVMAPLAPSGLGSTTHLPSVWSALGSIGMRWSGASDPPPSSGLAGYSVVFDTLATTVPDTTVDVPQSADPHGVASAPLPEGQSHYFHLRACDHGGNCSAAVHAGPYWIDTTAPVEPASVTSSSHVPGVPSNETTLALQWTAAVDPLSNGVASGIDGYGWFVDDAPGTRCSRVKAVEEATTAVIMDMQSGTWYAHVCAVDHAGNWSPVATAGPYLIGDPADLSLTLVDDADPIHVNGTVTYTATYANAGPSPAPSTWLYVTLPPGLGFVSSVPGEPVCSSSGELVKCGLGDLSSLGGGSVTVTAQAQQGVKGQRVVTGRLRAATSDPDLSNNDVAQSTWVKFVKGDLQDDWATDLYLRNVTTGENVAWLMNGTTRLGEAAIDPPAPTYATQQVSGVDDFDGDGRNDLAFWDGTTGAPEFWLMNGATRVGDPVPLTGGSQAPPWSLAATADFDRDGWPDLLWRNTSTQKLVVWTLNGTAKSGEIVPSPDQAVHANWQVVGAVDLNGDGPVDLLWYNVSTGKIVYWWMDALVQRITGNFTSPASAGNANWKVLATGDYGAGPGGVPDTADLVWRNETSGRYVVWHLDLAGNRTAGTFTTPDAPTSPLDWTIAGPR